MLRKQIIPALLALTLAETASADASRAPPASSGDGLVTLPLLTRSHVVSRRLRESGSDPGRAVDLAREPLDRRPLPRALSQSQQQLGSLYQGYGTHYVDIWVGYPPQRQTAVVDTGSSVTAFPCSGCEGCGVHADEPFDPGRSQSFHVTPCSGGEGRPCVFGTCELDEGPGGECRIEHSYGSGGEESGWKAFEADDVAYAGGTHDAPAASAPGGEGEGDGIDPNSAAEFSFALTFGCQTEASGYFEKQLASGVMGLDRRAQSFWGQMRSQQVIHRAQFSLCFVRQPLASRAGTTAGAVTLGGTEPRLNLTPMVFAKTVVEGGAAGFKVRVRKIYLRESGGTSVMYDKTAKYHPLEVEEEELNGEGQFDIDSGTTDTYFTESISGEFRRVWTEVTGKEYSNDPVKLSDDELRKLPSVMLQLIPHEGGVGDEVTFDNPAEINGLAGNVDISKPNDILFAIPATHYMQHNAKDGTYTARIYLDRDDAAGSILGANAMMGHNVLFDIDSGRIGLAESECDYSRLVAEATGTAARSEVGAAASDGSAADGEGGSHQICGSLKCKGFMGLTCTVFFLGFFLFARRYVTKRDDFGDHGSEFEMKSSRGSNGRGGGYSDDDEDHSSERGYRDRGPPTSYSDSDRSRSSDRGSRHHGSSYPSHSSRRGSNDDGSHRSNSHSHRGDSSRGGDRSQKSAGGSIQSQHSSRSQRSHQSVQSHRTSSSHRSSGERSTGTRGTHGSGGSRESHRSHRSGTSRSSGRSDRYGSSGRRDRYDDYDEEISRPPSIS